MTSNRCRAAPITAVAVVAIAATAAAAFALASWTSDAPQGARVVGLGSAAPWGSADPRTPTTPTTPTAPGPPVQGQAGPVVGGLAATSVGVLVVDGGRHQCSAAVVASRSRRLLATAAHCVWLGGAWRVDGAFFIPGYAAGEEPHGRWAVDTAYVPPAWQEANSPISDVAAPTDFAFVTLLPRNGVLPEQALGAQGIRFTTDSLLPVAALGYPATGVYDGQSLRGCDGDAAVQPFDRPGRPSGQVLALTCDMTEGASGGPWLTGPDAARGRGQVIGVVSGGDDTTLVSPRFDEAARTVYEAADSAALLPKQQPTPGSAPPPGQPSPATPDPAIAQTAPRTGSSR